MSEEIVKRIMKSKKKMLFESDSVTKDVEDLEKDLVNPELEGELPQEEEDELKESVEETEEISSPEESPVCVCGSKNIVEENGKLICDDCGREVVPGQEEMDETEKKYSTASVIHAALRLWSEGKYEKAVLLCQKYGVSDREFVRALSQSFHESEEIEVPEEDDVDESLSIEGVKLVKGTNSEYLKLVINGSPYYYRPKDSDIQSLYKSYKGVAKYSLGKALAWLKKNSVLVSPTLAGVRDSKKIRGNDTLEESNIHDASSNGFDMRSVESGESVRFTRKGMTDVPVVGKRFKVGWLSGKCTSLTDKEAVMLVEDAELEVIAPEDKSNLEKNIIYAMQTPVSTAKRPNLDAAITEALSTLDSFEVKAPSGQRYKVSYRSDHTTDIQGIRPYDDADYHWAKSDDSEDIYNIYYKGKRVKSIRTHSSSPAVEVVKELDSLNKNIKSRMVHN